MGAHWIILRRAMLRIAAQDEVARGARGQLMTTVVNPILPGFNPDPSICRVDEDYYIATSTFEWHPCVQIHHSRDIANWRLVQRPLDRASQSAPR